MAPLPEFLTKHCKPSDREHMLAGCFKIGTLSEFRAAEVKNGAFSDHDEGRSRVNIRGDLTNWSGQIGTNTYRNVTSRNVAVAIQVEDEIDAHAFCASAGPFDADRLERLRAETDTYIGNPEWTAHLVLNTAALLKAFRVMQRVLGLGALIVPKAIQYGSRDLDGVENDIPVLLADKQLVLHSLNCVFVKTEQFAIEEEFRIGLIPLVGPTNCRAIMTRDHPELHAAFIAAIADKGSAGLDAIGN